MSFPIYLKPNNPPFLNPYIQTQDYLTLTLPSLPTNWTKTQWNRKQNLSKVWRYLLESLNWISLEVWIKSWVKPTARYLFWNSAISNSHQTMSLGNWKTHSDQGVVMGGPGSPNVRNHENKCVFNMLRHISYRITLWIRWSGPTPRQCGLRVDSRTAASGLSGG